VAFASNGSFDARFKQCCFLHKKGIDQPMKTLYTGHITINTHYIYSFIYADTLMEAEEHLKELLGRYILDHFTALPWKLPPIKVVSRPNGWNPPDSYYLPGTSKQYALKYSSNLPSGAPQEAQTILEKFSLPTSEIELEAGRHTLLGR
jgi:hypothetical protein